MKTLLYCLLPSIQILSNTPHFPVTPCYTPLLAPNPNPHPTVIYVVRFLCYFCCPVCYLFAILLNDNMDLHMLSLGTLVSEGPWFVFYATRHQVYRGLAHNMFFYWCSNLISHTHKHTQHTSGPVEWQTHIICLPHLLCAHSNYFYYIKWLNE